jgi:hypothetical protein
MAGIFHCSGCGNEYNGYHHCPAGADRIEFACSVCGEHIDRESSSIDIKGLVPQRCATCTLERLARY